MSTGKVFSRADVLNPAATITGAAPIPSSGGAGGGIFASPDDWLGNLNQTVTNIDSLLKNALELATKWQGVKGKVGMLQQNSQGAKFDPPIGASDSVNISQRVYVALLAILHQYEDTPISLKQLLDLMRKNKELVIKKLDDAIGV